MSVASPALVAAPRRRPPLLLGIAIGAVVVLVLVAAFAPLIAPNDPLMSRIGASVPPDVPEASAIHHAQSFATASINSVSIARRPDST